MWGFVFEMCGEKPHPNPPHNGREQQRVQSVEYKEWITADAAQMRLLWLSRKTMWLSVIIWQFLAYRFELIFFLMSSKFLPRTRLIAALYFCLKNILWSGCIHTTLVFSVLTLQISYLILSAPVILKQNRHLQNHMQIPLVFWRKWQDCLTVS